MLGKGATGIMFTFICAMATHWYFITHSKYSTVFRNSDIMGGGDQDTPYIVCRSSWESPLLVYLKILLYNMRTSLWCTLIQNVCIYIYIEKRKFHCFIYFHNNYSHCLRFDVHFETQYQILRHHQLGSLFELYARNFTKFPYINDAICIPVFSRRNEGNGSYQRFGPNDRRYYMCVYAYENAIITPVSVFKLLWM